MIKKIGTSELQVGMFIHDLDARWLDHPFFASRFLVKDEQTIQRIASAGLRRVYIDTERGRDVDTGIALADVADVVDGTLYVQLIDPDSFETVYRQAVTSEAGIFRFSFPSVAEGRYLIFAGTNLDNDALVGDAGEANGAYLSLAQPVTLQVDQNLNGLDFGVGFNPILSAQSRQASEPGRSPEFIPAF